MSSGHFDDLQPQAKCKNQKLVGACPTEIPSTNIEHTQTFWGKNVLDTFGTFWDCPKTGLYPNKIAILKGT